MRTLAGHGRKAVVPYIVAGDREPPWTVPAMHALVASGADIIELGVPFSDPMAEGPVIQLGHERALQHAVGLLDVLRMVSEFRRTDNATPLVLMGYANPIEALGYPRFAAQAAAAGVDGVLTVDMPPEEADGLDTALREFALDIIYLIAPTTSDHRMREICDRASGYLYYVSLKGVTGAGHLDADAVAGKVATIKSMTELPVAVGFGIKDAASARAVAQSADGVVVGSVLVDAMGKANTVDDMCAAVSAIVADIGMGASAT